MTIDILPDDILLFTFNVFVNDSLKTEEWHALVHVCQRWRTLVFGSPRHLNLQLLCTAKTPVREKLDIWPSLPMLVHNHHHCFPTQMLDNLVAAIEHNDRVCGIDLTAFHVLRQLEKIVSVMQVPFPELTDLKLALVKGDNRTPPVLPNMFLGRSAPHLRHLKLDGFSFPGLHNLLLSATGLVSLELQRIPHSWYISPDAMVTLLSALTCLQSLTLEFCQPRPDRESQHSPPPTRALMPALTRLKLEGVNEYEEDLMARIDAPQLDNLDITLFDRTVFDISHLVFFISRMPKFHAPDEAHVDVYDGHILVTLLFPSPGCERLVLGILHYESTEQILSLIQLCRPFLPDFAIVERLYICQSEDYRWGSWHHGIRRSHCLELLRYFTNVKDLYISGEITTFVIPALEKLIGERTTEVLPDLQNLFFYLYKAVVEDFIAARELSGHPITASCWSPYM